MLPLMVFSIFLIVQHDTQTILKYCFSNQSDFCVHPIFHHNVIPIHTFFSKPCFHTRKITFSGKNISPSLNVHFWKIIHDIISLSPNSSTLKCILKSTSIKNHSQPSGHEQSFLIFQFFQIPKQVDLNINLVKVKAYIGF